MTLGPDFELAETLQALAGKPLTRAAMLANLETFAVESAQRVAADNLLTKAVRASGGFGQAEDGAKVDRYITRALQLPYDDEEADTALFAAHMMVFEEITDLLEESDEDDASWLDAVEQTLETGPDAVREHLLRTLDIIRRDYVVSPAEKRRIVAALGRHPQPPSDEDTCFRPQDQLLPDDQRERFVRSAVQTVAELNRLMSS